jgi:hypothetical protein
VRSTRIVPSLTCSAPRAGRETGGPRSSPFVLFAAFGGPSVRRASGELRTDGRHRDDSDHVLAALRNETQLGFKQVKWIKGIEFVAHYSELGSGYGGYNQDHEFFGYRQSI